MSDAFVFPRVPDLLDQLGIRLSRHKSQHFLHNHAQAARIAEFCELTPSHRALEIGAGLGNLSVELARRAGAVVSVEMDEHFTPWHATLTAHFPNLHFHYEDFLKADLARIIPREPAGPLVAVGNLPYQITAPILFRLVNGPQKWERIVVMVQLEVAERIVAGPKSRRASALTYKLAFEYDARLAARLGPREFIPPPKVHSAVVVLTPRKQPLLRDAAHKQRLHELVSALFQHRRRTLPNALTLGGVLPSRAEAEVAVVAAGIDPRQRPETLELDDVLRLEDILAAEKAR